MSQYPPNPNFLIKFYFLKHIPSNAVSLKKGSAYKPQCI